MANDIQNSSNKGQERCLIHLKAPFKPPIQKKFSTMRLSSADKFAPQRKNERFVIRFTVPQHSIVSVFRYTQYNSQQPFLSKVQFSIFNENGNVRESNAL